MQCDLLIVGGGIAGLSAAIEASKFCKVIGITKGRIGETATEKAQGGIAAAIDQIKDSTDYHLQDTLAAGAGLCDEKAVRVLVEEGVLRVKELIKWGAQFDRAETEAGGGYALALEGAHKKRRILHAGDETGAEIERTLAAKVKNEKLAELFPRIIGIDLLIENGRCVGIKALDIENKKIMQIYAKAVLLATGGLCQIYLYTTNPDFATGDGIAMAYRAGAVVTDMEFVQFHPTSLVHTEEFKDIIALPRFLISEAVRGEGAKLVNNKGERFLDELAPRDIVSRAIIKEMDATMTNNIFLVLKDLGPEKIKQRFPVIYKTCLERGLDITKDPIPVAPAAHYFMGGIKTDLDGKTTIPGLYAAGETASTGVHGANRLASNSLLEGLVFGNRAAKALEKEIKGLKDTLPEEKEIEIPVRPKLKENELTRLKLVIKSALWHEVGIIREEKGLTSALGKIKKVQDVIDDLYGSQEEIELRNMALVARLVTRAALERQESRGGHFRSDFPGTDDRNWKKHLSYTILKPDGTIC